MLPLQPSLSSRVPLTPTRQFLAAGPRKDGYNSLRATIGHRTLGIVIRDLIEAIQCADVPEVVEQRQGSVKLLSYGGRTGSLHVNMPQTLFQPRVWVFVFFVLAKERSGKERKVNHQKEK
jgi:hypothetical protein